MQSKLVTMVHAYNPSTPKTEDLESGVGGLTPTWAYHETPYEKSSRG